MINHDVVRLHVPVHNPLTVTVIESLQEFVDVVANIVIDKLGV